MAVSRSRSVLLSAALLCALGLWASPSFVPAPEQGVVASQQLRGAAALAGVAAAAAPLSAIAVPDDLIEYNYQGEFTQYMITGYFALTTALTFVAFFSYLILTKLKII
mmetsp:Transcript_114222/g.243622  ORF Transcript_114222/g.243622 Transcript_114222/m.243622 type:complete len:108 (+) Transcript_114222:90-413(+)